MTRPPPIGGTTLYLLHIHPPIEHAHHYLGATKEGRLRHRLAEHQTGRGAALTRIALERGSTLTLVRTWHQSTWAEERRLKQQGHIRRLCPVCNGSLPAPDCWAYPPLRQVICVASSVKPLGWD